jgi:inorganic pyrophosphatase
MVRARIEVPRGSFIKRELHGEARLDFVSPLPSPFNYGFLPGVDGEDGDPVDAVILGPRLPLGAEIERPVVARVRFVDAGQPDSKLVLSDRPLSRRQRMALVGFFRLYAHAKRALNLLRGARGPTRFEGLDEDPYSAL